MTSLEISGIDLVLHVEGLDALWALKRCLTVPLAHVVGVERATDEARKVWSGFRIGTNLPGVIKAGTFFGRGGMTFWCVHDARHAIAVELRDERYARLVIEVADPDATIRRVLAALPAQ